MKAIDLLRKEGYKVGLVRPITLFPYPSKIIAGLAERVKGFLTIEMSTGQMVEDVMLAVNGKRPVKHYGRVGGVVPTPEEIVDAMKNFMKGE